MVVEATLMEVALAIAGVEVSENSKIEEVYSGLKVAMVVAWTLMVEEVAHR